MGQRIEGDRSRRPETEVHGCCGSARPHQKISRRGRQGGGPKVRRRRGQAQRWVGDIYRMLGRHRKAEEAYCQAVAVLTQLAEVFPAEAEYRRELAACRNNLGMLWFVARRHVEAEAALQQ